VPMYLLRKGRGKRDYEVLKHHNEKIRRVSRFQEEKTQGVRRLNVKSGEPDGSLKGGEWRKGRLPASRIKNGKSVIRGGKSRWNGEGGGQKDSNRIRFK